MRILLGISGGLDSTYCATLLKEQGHTVEGAVLVFNDHTDIDSARTSCRELDIPLHVIDCRDAFEKYVISDFTESYKTGRTPNPCTVCNRYVKMEYLYRACLEKGFDRYATGHYANINYDTESGRYYVSKGLDTRKDQSYMLWKMTQEQLSMLITPLSQLTKDQVRQGASLRGLTASGSKESQDICFIPRGSSYVDFVEERLGKFPEGEYVDKEGNKIGVHKGIINYTVGQRKGLGASFGRHMFITGISSEDNKITLCEENDTYAKGISVKNLSFQKTAPVEEGELELSVKIRYAAPAVPCRVCIKNGNAQVELLEAVRTPAPGQSAVFYTDSDLCLGGVIDRVYY